MFVEKNRETFRPEEMNMGKTDTVMASATIRAPVSIVWEAITKPELIMQHLFGTDMISD